MKFLTNSKKGTRIARSLYITTLKSLVICALMISSVGAPLQAQEVQYTSPSWYFGAAVGVNLNFYRGSTQQLNADLTVPRAFHNGFGGGLFFAPLVEYHRPDSRFGFMLQAGYDNRNGIFNQILTPCNCPADLLAGLSYITVEPSLRYAPFKTNFYFFGGPRVAFNLEKSFTYKQKDYVDQEADAEEIVGDFSDMRKVLLSMQIGAGYDFPLTSEGNRRQDVFSIFVSFQPYFGQSPRAIETWNITTLRAGAAIKFGRGREIVPPLVAVMTPIKLAPLEPDVQFTVRSPSNIAVDRRVRETFPLRNYIFFNSGSTEIPDRYVLLNINQVKDFKEDQLEVFTPKDFSGRSKREMVVYYNVLNILGDRMGKNPGSTIVLVGSSENGPQDGRMMAESVKKYLVDVFAISPSRIAIEGREKPKIPSEQPGGTLELKLLREGDQRVSVESSSPDLLMEFTSGADVPLRPVEFRAVQEAPLDSYVSFHVDGGTVAFSSWSLEIMDAKGTVQKFGPFTQDHIVIPGKTILGAQPEGNFTVTMVGQTKSGKTIKKEAFTHMVLWTPSENEQGMRFSVIYEFNDANSIAIYDRYLSDIVAPQIPIGGTVYIHGYTDIIGDEANNQKLSLARATDVKNILEKSLAKAGRNDVKFEVYGFGEDEYLSPFENKLPEERFYNRTVIIDIIPGR